MTSGVENPQRATSHNRVTSESRPSVTDPAPVAMWRQDDLTGVPRPLLAPCHICKKPQPPCPHEGCYRHYGNGHQDVRTTTVEHDGYRFQTTRCHTCGAGFGGSAIPIEWDAS